MRTRTKFLSLGLGFVLLAGVVFAPIAARRPFPQGDRMEHEGLVGLKAGMSLSWIIPTETGVVLVDAGSEPGVELILAEIGDRTVHAVLITHGHFDHTAGLAVYKDIPIYVGPGEGALMRGEIKPGGWMARMSTFMMGSTLPNLPNMIEFEDGQDIVIDGTIIRAMHTPGHTLGSAMYVWRNTLFSGDSIVSRGDHVSEIPKATADNYAQIRDSVARVLEVDFDRMADGHSGLQQNARLHVENFVSGQ